MTPFQEKLLEEIRYEAAKSASCTTDAEGHRAALLTIVDDLRAEVARLTADNEKLRSAIGVARQTITTLADPSALPAGAHPTDDWADCAKPVTLGDEEERLP